MAIKPEQASAQLIDLNTGLHAVMGDILNEKSVEEGIATIPYGPVSVALDCGVKAATILNEVKPGAPELPNIEMLTEAISTFIYTVKPVEGKITTSDEVASSLNDTIINSLANSIHDAAMSLIGATGKLQACTVAQVLPEETAAVSKYCSGVLSGITHDVVVNVGPLKHITVKGKKEVHSYPTLIEHKLGIHRAKVSTLSGDGEAKVALEYRESGPQYKDMPGRQKGVHDRLIKEGFTCNVGETEDIPFGKDLSMYCWGDVDKDKLRQLATFFSLLLNADIAGMGKDTAEVVSEKAWDVAGKLNQQYGDETWKSGQGQLNWSVAHSQWKQEKEIYQKEAIYIPLKALALCRDRHHEIEEKYNIAHGTKSLEGATYVLSNAKEALGIITKNKWAAHGLGGLITQLDNMVASKNLGGLTHVSDGVGHIMHVALNGVLHSQGTYGGCDTTGNIEDTNSGTLAYCEGVLKGTSAVPKGGVEVIHKIAPRTQTTFVIDENPGGGYDLHIPLPEKDAWSKSLKSFLAAHHEFDCTKPYGAWKAGQICSVHIDNLENIRFLALFLSNLRGASGAIGAECIPKALETAHDMAKGQKQKGIFAFTQEPVMPSAKAWIDTCHKKYGILPPGLTEEEKEVMTLLGPEMTYAGCSFGEVEAVPNEGILTYCEGIRKNPQAEVNAHFHPDGKLWQYYHGTQDKIADVNIIPLGEGKYQVELSNIALMGDVLQDEAVKRLKEYGYTCPSKIECSREVSSEQLRHLAVFLSSVHQIYKLEPYCVPAAVDHTLAEAGELATKGKEAHEKVAYPWYQPEWNKEICSKLPGAPPEIAKPPKEVVVEKPAVPGKPPFKVGGCTSIIAAKPTKVRHAYCQGVSGQITVEGTTQPLKYKGLIEGTAASLGKPENKHYLAGPILTFDSKWNNLYITLPPELANIKLLSAALVIGPFWMNKENENTFSLKYVTYAGQVTRIARFLSYLSGIHELPEWCHEAVIKYARDKTTHAGTQPIYPYHPDDWLKEVCEPFKPPEEKPAPKKYADLPADEQDVVKVSMQSLIEVGVGKIDAIKQIREMWNLQLGGLPQLWDELKEGMEKIKWEDLGPAEMEAILKEAEKQIEEGQGGLAYLAVLAKFGLQESDELKSIIEKKAKAWLEKKEKPSLEELIGKSMEKWKELVEKTPSGAPEWEKAKTVKEYKKLPKAIKDILHAYINYNLLWGYKHGMSYADTLQHLQNSIIKSQEIPITPLMVKLQTDIEKKKKQRRGELPAEPGEEVTHTYEDLEQWEKGSVYDLIKEEAQLGSSFEEISGKVKDVFSIEESFDLNQLISGEIEIAKAKPPEEVLLHYSDMPKEKQAQITAEILTAVQQGQHYEAIKEKIEMLHPELEWDAEIGDIVDKLTMEWAEEVKPPEKKLFKSTTELQTFLLSYLQQHPEVTFTIDELAKAIQEGGYYIKFMDQAIDALEVLEGKGLVIEPTTQQYKLAAPPIYFEDLPIPETGKVVDKIDELVHKGWGAGAIKMELKTLFGLQESPELDSAIMTAMQEWEKEKKAPAVSKVAEAIETIKKGNPYAGCHPVKPGVELNAPMVTYCEGILTPPHDIQAGYVMFPTKEVAALLGMPEQLPVIGQFGDGYEVKATAKMGMGYTLDLLLKDFEKSGKEWKTRQEAVAKTLTEKLGYTCGYLDDSVTCKRPEAPFEPEQIDAVRTTALFLSKLGNIDKLEAACVKTAVRDAFDRAELLNQNLKEQAYVNPVYPHSVEEWEKEVCSKIPTKPVRIEAKELAKLLGTSGLIKEAGEMGVDPSGSDEALAKKLLDAGYLPEAE